MNPGTHLIGGWEGPRAGLDVLEEEKKSIFPTGIRNPEGPATSLAAMPHTLFRLQYYYYYKLVTPVQIHHHHSCIILKVRTQKHTMRDIIKIKREETYYMIWSELGWLCVSHVQYAGYNDIELLLYQWKIEKFFLGFKITF